MPERVVTGEDAAALRALLHSAESGDRRALARLISAAERGVVLPPLPLDLDAPEHLCIGVTGAPGAGKSTLVSALATSLLEERESVAVLAVDPSSPISRGALLGDRVRMHRHATTPNVFIRSMATRARRGGLAGATQQARRLLQHCGWPLVLVETVGVGQIELDIVKTADIAVVVLNPGWGDEIQANKAGLMEIADIFVINKADRPGAAATRRDIEAILINRPAGERPAVIETVATEERGIADLRHALQAIHTQLRDSGRIEGRRREQLREELTQSATRRFAHGLGCAAQAGVLADIAERVADGTLRMETAGEELYAWILANGTDTQRGIGR